MNEMNYLYTEYGYTELEYHLSSADDIVDYFMDVGYDSLDCGEGFYTDEADVKIFIDGKSYVVTIKGEVGSHKQDRGDRMYYIEDIISVTYTEIPTPPPLSRKNYSLGALVNVTEDQYNRVLNAIKQICNE